MPQTTPHLIKSERKAPNYKLRFIILIALAALCFFISLGAGRYGLSPYEVIRILFSGVIPFDEMSYYDWSVIFNVRIPRICAAFLVGAALATAGAAYQGMFQNPLVSPDILGASAGAGFGAAFAIYTNQPPVMITVFAFTGAIIAVLVAYGISRLAKGNATLSLVLGGILVGGLFTACTSYVKLVADTANQLPEITYWLMGGLSSMEMSDVIFALIGIGIGIIPLILLRWRLNVLTLGDDEARSMGINTRALRLVTIICATLITAVAVSISGLIGWVGLVIPHFCRMIFGYDYRRIIPAAIIFGGAFLILVDDFARNLAAIEIPIGILTAFVGAPIFAWLLISGGKRS
ncbi:MAG TPA: iron ABC transporter permease [Methanocorpusculum sp.]|nr:iron ABC transporter permease [Methanocorpusculum sp.]